MSENIDCYINLTQESLNNNKSEEIISSIENIVQFAKETFDNYENDSTFKMYSNKNDNDDTIDDFIETRIQQTKDKLEVLGKHIIGVNMISSVYNMRRE